MRLIPPPALRVLTTLLPLVCTLMLSAATTSPTDHDNSAMNNQKNYTTAFTVDQTPEAVFAAINNVRGWWSGEIQGATDRLGAEFTYRVPGVHYSKQKITEFIPGKKVVWHVSDADLAFVQDKDEWKGTDIVFEIAKKGDKTEVRFTHVGLVPPYECYDSCSNAWGLLVEGNLRKLITTGKPQPSPWPAVKGYTTVFTVDQTPKEAFDAINNVRGWWSDEIEGRTDQLGEFKYHYKDIHRCTIRVTELSPGKKVTWHVVANYFNFVKDKTEWVDTDIVFAIARVGDKTEVRFTHVGLSPQHECYGVCSDAWGTYINGSLRDLIAKGKGQPNQNEQLARKHGQE
ncbi:Uncharacterized conserved protein YndB, AHSA1/START domain [Opitutus sp. GAS368]|nr:Uncharacterized conserved protein YndB, AHSA1/START domain [Opitutus sp. GAS368]